MKLTKKLEAEALKFYHDYWDVYLAGDIKSFSAALDDSVTIVGTAISEIFNNKKQTVKFYKGTVDQMTNSVQLRNRKISVQPAGHTVIIHEQTDFYVLMDKKWTFYGHVRLSAVLIQTKKSWKLIHQHASFPDSRAEEGEQLASKKIAAENLKLREAVERRTVELEQKNRELEIETALEKVRAIAMGMKEPADMLQVCKTISLQLNSLGIKETRNVQTAIFYEDKGTYMNYEYYAKHDKTIITETTYTNHKIQADFAAQMLKGKGEFFSTHIKGKKKVTDWLDYQKTTNVFIDSFLETAKSLNYYWFSLGPVALGISTYAPLSEEETALFKRFLKVFELSYRRYLDIEKAEAQAKEAKIEASLERVRAVAMSMMKSEELLNVSEVLVKEFRILGFETIRNAQIDIFNDTKRTYLNYECDAENLEKTITEVAYDSHTLVQSYLETIKSSKDAFFVHTIKEKEFESWKSFVKTTGYIKNVIPAQATSLVYYNYSIGVGSLGISTYGALDENSIITLKRFRNVFELAYRRYSDVAQAEAQAKEVQIELALERVRARTMAMQKSEELPDAANLLFQQVQALGMPAWSAGYCIWDDDKQGITLWMSSEGVIQPSFHMPLSVDPSLIHWKEAYERHKSFHMEAVGGEELVTHYKYMRTLPGIGEVLDSIINAGHPLPTFQIFHCAYFSQGFLLFITYEPVPEAHEIFKRFGKVFDQTYTRFLDLEKAEAQTREAQIETALEKIRSRSLGMHHSVEIKDVVAILFEKLKELGLAFDGGAAIHLFAEGTRNATIWVASPDLSEPSCVNLPYDKGAFENNPIIADVWNAKETGEHIYNKSYSFGEKNRYFEYVFKYNDFITIPKASREFILHAESYTASFIAEKNSLLGANSWSRLLISDNDFEILKRITRVFEQAYIRFLDLQKAEAQARESQIEAALERVRSRTMAMHKSDELLQVVTVLADQLTQLDFKFDNVSFGENNQDDDFKFWFIAAGQSQPLQIQVPYKDNPAPNRVKEAQKKGVKFFADILSKEENRQWTQHLIDHSPVKFFPDKVKDYILNSVGYARSTYVLKNINLYIGNYRAISYTEEENNLFQRFAQVFEQSYTRFLDLKKAEAQAREAQIEAALEKVRSRSLAMHKSEELREVVSVVFEKLQELDFLMDDKAVGILIFKEGTKDHVQWIADPGHSYPTYFKNPYTEHSLSKDLIGAKESGADYFAKLYSFEEKNDFFNYLFQHTDYRDLPEEIKNLILATKSYGFSVAFAKNSAILVPTNSGKLLSDTEKEIIKRFVKVFEQSYTRFLDLQKAEAQAREAKIEAALERTRTQSMIMQHSNELDDTLRVFHEQVLLLNIKSAFSFLWLPDEENDRHIFWAAWAENNSTTFSSKAINYPLDRNEPATKQCLIDWKGNETVVSYRVPPAGVAGYFAAWQELIDGVEQLKPEYFSGGLYYVEAFMKYGCFGVMIEKEMPKEEKKILERFSIEFERTYTRFLDLQKAEAQARESQIQLALERVRARTMAMQKSDELADVAELLSKQVKDLGIKTWTSGFNIWSEDNNFYTDYITNPLGGFMPSYTIDARSLPVGVRLSNAKKSGQEFYVNYEEGEALAETYRTLLKFGEKQFTSILESGFDFPTSQYEYFVFGSKVSLMFITYEAVPEAEDIFKRFGKVFEQTYTRFLDLQKAEAQARESQIELSLERVRAKTMAMHNSQDVADTVGAMFDEVVKLGIQTIRCGIGIMHPGGEMEVWTAKPDENGKVDLIIGRIDMMMHPLLKGAYTSWENKIEFYTYDLIGDDLIAYFTAINNYPDYPIKYDIASLPSKIIHSEFHFPEGTLFVFALEKLPEETFRIFKRFAGVFGQTYRRYLDLKKAESQARSAQIEAAMEKVRARSLAMQKPEELTEVAEVLRKEMGALGVEELETSSIYIHHENTQKTECWYAIKDVNHLEKELVSDHMAIMLPETVVGRQMLEFYHSDSKRISIPMQGADRKEWINYCADHSKVLTGFYGDSIPDRTYHLYKFSNGYMGAASPGDISKESWDLLQRATSVFSFAYTRFLDLQNAAEREREAQIELALERVRARTLAMQRSDELAETSAVLFRQLIGLGIAPNRLYIGIINKDEGEMEFWITDEDGSKVSTMFSGNAEKNSSMKKMYDGWKTQQKSISIDMQGKELEDYFHYLGEELHVPFKDGLEQKRRLQYISYFSKGFIGMASPEDQPTETINLLERFAYVFNLTFTRFNDLKIAEAHALQAEEDLVKLQTEKKRAEEALTELKATQTQLIQAEKMASLGQLTAGIAHEIQNPLNFVNNFSEVSEELIKEMLEEVNKGNIDEVKAIAGDLVQNLEKIYHHGKRADSIVKGMLEHSRTSTGNMEPTDINALADEYFRLSYHGIRAKDKSFNTAINTHFDTSIDKINIIGQDIGRVLLNLYNNSFYAVNEKKKQLTTGYEPAVSVTTKKTGDAILISVNDNGNGIPQNIIDKIFQPFFTTKPTGSGTGLGLSLAYDIVKAHGGELKVESTEGSGTAFIISLIANG